MLKSYQFRCEQNGEQENLFNQYAGSCRFIYNQALLGRKATYRVTGKSVSVFDQNYQLVSVKKQPGCEFLSDVPAQCLQQALADLGVAYKNFFEDLAKFKAGAIRRKQIRVPKLHKKGKDNDSFRFPQPSQFQLEGKRMKLPKLGWVKFSKSQKIKGNPKSVTLSKRGKQWYISILCEVFGPDEPMPPEGPAIGIDLNADLGVAVAISDGQNFETAKTSKQEYRKLAKLHRIVSRRKKGSNGYREAVEKLAAFEAYRANRRKDAIHKITSWLANNHSIIVIEDLAVKNMTRSAKGTVEKPGRNVKAKSGLNRVMLDRAPGYLRQVLEYKCKWSGAILIKVNPSYTSQRCSRCGKVRAASRNGSLFECVFCGFKLSAHTNAAINILADGLLVLTGHVKPQSVDLAVSPSVELGHLFSAETHRTELVSC